MRKFIIALMLAALAVNPLYAQSGPKFGKNGGVGSSTSTFDSGEPVGGTYAINGTTGRVSAPIVNLRPGAAPASPLDGDCWTTTDGAYCRVSGGTVGPFIGPTYTAPVPGAVSQTIPARLAKQLFVTDYGVKCDGVTDDTSALNVAYSAAAVRLATLYFPSGICLTAGNTITGGYAGQFAIKGNGRNQTIIKKTGATPTPVLTIGSLSATNFYANLEVSGITFDGGASSTTAAALRSYDLVRSHIHDVAFMNAVIGYDSLGGIANNLSNVVSGGNQIGMNFDKFTSLAGGGWPNLIKISGSQIVDNQTFGIAFNNGRMLMVDSTDVEGNGTTLGANQGGIHVGPNVGAEVTVSDPLSLGLVVTNSWFEANRGVADVYVESGINSVENSNFFSHSDMVTNDVRIDGGRYRLKNLNISFSKTANVLEGASAETGNLLEFVQAANLSYSSTKTMLVDGYRAFVGNGAIPGINGMNSPLIVKGADATGGNPTISFSQAFKAGTTPQVFAQVVNNAAGTIENVEVYSVSNTAFTMRKKSFNGTTIGTSNYTVNWMAIGENP